MSWNRELTLDDVLSDPVIGAVMAADRVDPRHFETLMRGTARRLDAGRPKAPPTAVLAARARCGASAGSPAAGVPCAW